MLHSLRRISLLLLVVLALVLALGISGNNKFFSSSANSDLAEEAWGQAGSIAYPAAAKTMRARNADGQPLDNFQKRYLRRYFLDLIDRVTVVYGAEMMDRWVVGGIAIRFGSVESSAQTYCDQIYLREPYKPEDFKQLIVIAHEMTHARQCEKLGGFDQFGYKYFVEFKRAGRVYERNSMEVEAYSLQKRFAQTL
jgi:hypothetical protein